VRKEVRERAFLPLAIPLGALAVIALVTITMSRILLNVPKEIATAVAAMVAINILVVFGVVAVKEKLTQTQLFMMMVAAVIPLVIGGAVAVGAVEIATEGEEHAQEEPPPAVALVAQNLAFQPTQLEAAAGEPLVINFDNRDSVQHNVAIFKGVDATGQNVFRGDLLTGPRTVTYQVPAQEPGSYFFLCDVHPTMTGTIQLAAEAEPKSGEPEAATASIGARNLTFDKAELKLGASTAVNLVFDNKEAQPHNISIFDGGDASAQKLFTGDLVNGPLKVTYKLPPLEPGAYFFQCDFHPTTMTGRVTVT
jgi:plastocyanin